MLRAAALQPSLRALTSALNIQNQYFSTNSFLTLTINPSRRRQPLHSDLSCCIMLGSFRIDGDFASSINIMLTSYASYVVCLEFNKCSTQNSPNVMKFHPQEMCMWISRKT